MMRQNANSTEMHPERIHSTNVIWMYVREQNAGQLSTFGEQLIDRCSERVLFVFVRRARIYHQQRSGGIDQVTICMRRWRLGRRAHRKADVVWTKLDAAHRLAIGVWR